MDEPAKDLPEVAPQTKTSGPSYCRNCGAELQGEYCSSCGQRDRSVIRFFPTLILEGLEGLFAFESKTYRTLWYLFSRPAFLTREYLAGRRVRYLPPMRLFIVFVLAFLFTISVNLFLESIGIDFDQPENEIELSEADDVEAELDAALNEIVTEVRAVTDPETANNLPEQELPASQDDFSTGVIDYIGTLSIPFLSEANNERFVAMLQERATSNIPAIQEDPQDFVNQLLEYAPFLMLVMMPLLALVQKVVYVTSGRYYVEHLVLTIHNHSFLFFTFVLIFVLDLLVWSEIVLLDSLAGFLGSALNIWVVIYLYLSQRRFFQQGYFVTGIKFLLITVTYGALFIVSILAVLLFGFFVY